MEAENDSAEGQEQQEQTEPAENQEAENPVSSEEANTEGSGESLTPEELALGLKKVQDQLKEQADINLRLQAEQENFKKRMRKEKADALKYAQMPLLKDLTGALANLERAVQHAREAKGNDSEALISGIEMVVKQLGDIFGRFGMENISAKGQPFDPALHEAVGMVETDEVPANHVVNEIHTGYILYDRVVQPAMVTVSKAKTTGEASPEPAQNQNDSEKNPEEGKEETT